MSYRGWRTNIVFGAGYVTARAVERVGFSVSVLIGLLCTFGCLAYLDTRYGGGDA